MVNYLSSDDMLRLCRTFAKKLNSYGFNINHNDIVGCELLDSDDNIGYAEVLGAHKFQLHVNKQLCKEGKTEYQKTLLYHELAHIIQYNEAFDQKVIRRDELNGNTEPLPGKEQLAYNLVYDNLGHTAFWEDIVKDIGIHVQFAVPITAYASKVTIEKMLEELFVKEARTYINNKGNLVHEDYVIGGLTLADMIKYSDKVPVRTEDLREALAKIDFSECRPVTPPGHKGPNATTYYSQKYIDEFERNKNNEGFSGGF